MPSPFTDSAAKALHAGTLGDRPFRVGFRLTGANFGLTNQLLEAPCSAVGHNPGLGPLFCAPKSLQGSARRVSTLGIVHQERRALKGRQIERPNQAETGSDGTSNCAA